MLNNDLTVQILTASFVTQGYLSMTNSNIVKYGNIVDFEARFQVLQDIDVSNTSNAILVEEVTRIPLPINDKYLHIALSVHSGDFVLSSANDRIVIYCRQTNGTIARSSYITLNFVYLCE